MNIRHNKEKVLDTGRQLLLEKGYNSLGVDEICKKTGMTKGAFYNAYKSKENFSVEAIRAAEDMTVNFLEDLLNKPQMKAVDRISNMYQHLFEKQSHTSYRGCMINNLMSEMGTSSNLMSRATAVAFGNFLKTINPVVKEAQRDGDLTSAIESNAITELLHAAFFGALTLSKSTKEFNTGTKTMKLLIKTLKN